MKIVKRIDLDKKFLSRFNNINQMVKYPCPVYIMMEDGNIIDYRVNELLTSVTYIENKNGNIFKEIGIEGNIKFDAIEVFHLIRDYKKYFKGLFVTDENKIYMETTEGNFHIGTIISTSYFEKKLLQIKDFNDTINGSPMRFLSDDEIFHLSQGDPVSLGNGEEFSILISKKVLEGWKDAYKTSYSCVEIKLNNPKDRYFLTRLNVERKDGIITHHFIVALMY